jgi:glucuronokinase
VRADRGGLGWAPARAALAGNPSDAYGGAVLAVTLPGWSARAKALSADRLRITPPSALVEASVRRFAREFVPSALGTEVQWQSSIPRDVGLAGSSALVIATLRALADREEVELEPTSLAALALAVEVDDLGIAAGLQDRVAQAFGGLVFMDFAAQVYERLDPSLLPPRLVAWLPEAAGHSGPIHDSLARRHAAGEPLVHQAMEGLAATARRARVHLVQDDGEAFGRCVDETFDLRAQMLTLDPRCVEMVEVARRCGASANYTGSGGAIVAVSPDLGRLEAAEHELRRVGGKTALIGSPGAPRPGRTPAR